MQSFDADDLDPPGDEDRGCHWCDDDSAIMGYNVANGGWNMLGSYGL
jgi:hypothetical protein